MADVKKIADDIYAKIQETVKHAKLVDKSDGFDIKDIRAIHDAVGVVVTEIERISHDDTFGTLSSTDKRNIAVDVLTRLLDFDIPWIPGFLEGTVKKKAINFIIDYTVEFMNKKLGKEWLS
jgi:hypothetical protein